MTRSDAARPAAFDLDAFLRASREDAERALAEVRFDDVPETLRAPIEYAIGVGGKRLRPILCGAAWSAITGAAPRVDVLRAASAIELIHAYSLVHDDLPFMDDDDVRRGRPTTHRVHGTATATVAGAAMIVLAFRVFHDALEALDLPPAYQQRALATFADAAGGAGMVGGQWLDLAGEGSALALQALEKVHALKTGALLRASVLIGGLLARATPSQIDGLGSYGAALGLAFQIADDLLDARGDSAAIGKVAGRDAALAKSTYPGLLGIEAAERMARDQTAAALGALAEAGLASPPLDALARYAVERSS